MPFGHTKIIMHRTVKLKVNYVIKSKMWRETEIGIGIEMQKRNNKKKIQREKKSALIWILKTKQNENIRGESSYRERKK